jgi:outer membrane protein
MENNQEDPMGYKQVILYCFVIALLVHHPAAAQDKMILTLDQSVAIALEKNPEIQIAEKEISKAKAGVGQAVSSIMPKINGSVNFQHNWSIQAQTIPNFIKMAMRLPDGTYVLPGVEQMPDYLKLSFGIDNTFMYGATLTQPLFLGGAGWAGIRIASASKRAAEETLEFKRQNLIYNTVNLFYGCLLAKEVVTVQEQALEQSQANLELVIKKVDAGTASGFDKMRAEVDAANLRPQLISARNGYQSALTGLKMIMGLPEESQIEIQGQLDFVQDPIDSLSLEGLQHLAFQMRPEFHALKAQKAMASGGVAVARSQFLPKLFFQTDYSYLAMRTDYRFKQNDFSKGLTSAISLQIPLFTGFGNALSYQKARLDYKIVDDSERQLGNGIAAETEIAHNKYQESRQKYSAAKESIAMAEEALRLANLMYAEGASTQLDVMGARLALTQSRLNYISSLYEYQMARYQLRKAAGILKGVL